MRKLVVGLALLVATVVVSAPPASANGSLVTVPVGDGQIVSGAFQIVPTRTPPVTLFVFFHPPGASPTNPVTLFRAPENPLFGGAFVFGPAN